jgi:hypothetical protein
MRMKASDLPAYLRKVSTGLDAAVATAESESLDEHVDKARELSMGPYSLAQLREMGHPYARANPHPPMHPGIINRQSGRFIEEWTKAFPRWVKGVLVSKAVNEAPYSGFLDRGTKFMIRRPLVFLVKVACRQKRYDRLRSAIAKLLEG